MNTKVEDRNKASAQEVAPLPGSTDLAVYDPGRDAGAGMENIGRDEYAVPFINILDAKSPQCAPPKAGGLEGAKAGSIFNTATFELFDGEKGVSFVPVHRDHNYAEWIPRNEDGSGGGFVGIRSPEDPLVIDLLARTGPFKKLPTSDGHELVETFYLYGIVVSEFGNSPGLVPFKSTGISAYKNFMSRVMGITYQGAQGPVRPALWAHMWMLGSQYKPAKKQGQSGWYIPRLWLPEEPPIKSRLKLNDPLYVQARELYESIKAGRVVAAKPNKDQQSNEDVPF